MLEVKNIYAMLFLQILIILLTPTLSVSYTERVSRKKEMPPLLGFVFFWHWEAGFLCV